MTMIVTIAIVIKGDDCNDCPLVVDVDDDHLLHNFQHICDHFNLGWIGEVQKKQKYAFKGDLSEHSNEMQHSDSP